MSAPARGARCARAEQWGPPTPCAIIPRVNWHSPLGVWLDRVDPSGTSAVRVVAAVVGLVLLGGLAVLDWLVFRAWFDSDYLRWYLENGALIAIVFGLVTLAWGDLNKVTGLVSAHPLEYLASCLALGTLPSLAAAAQLESGRSQARSEELRAARMELSRQLDELAGSTQLSDEMKQRFAALSGEAGPSHEYVAATSEPDVTPRGLGLVDVVLGVLFGPAFLLVFVAWLLVVAPLQFVVNLAAGAPARLALASPARAWYRITPHEIHVEEALKSDSVPEGATESGFSAKPVTFTAAIASALLFAVSRLAS